MKNLIMICICVMFAIHNSASQQITQTNAPSIRQNVIQFTVLPGSKKVGAALKYKSLYQLVPVMHLGWGAGLESYDASRYKSFVPLTLEVMGDFSASNRAPFYTLGLGYGVPLAEEDSFAEAVDGGFTYDVALGYRVRSATMQPLISVGYRALHARYYGEDQTGDDNKFVTYKRWSLTVGVIF